MFKDRAIETIQAGFTGTGTYNLGGAALNSQALDAAFGSGATMFYVVRTATWSKVELGYGVVTSGSPDTLTRNVMRSYNGTTWGTSAVSWVSGDHPLYVYSVPMGEALASLLKTNAATTRPGWLPQYGIWVDIDTPSGTVWTLKFFDGTDDISLGTIDSVANAFAAAGNYLPLAGGTMTGDLTISKANPQAIFSTGAAAEIAGLRLQRNAVDRWVIIKGNDAESGSNSGSNFSIIRYNDAGAIIDAPISILRSTAAVTLTGALTVGGNLISAGGLANHNLGTDGAGNPLWLCDTGSDGVIFVRASNYWDFVLGGATVARIDSTGLSIGGPQTLKFGGSVDTGTGAASQQVSGLAAKGARHLLIFGKAYVATNGVTIDIKLLDSGGGILASVTTNTVNNSGADAGCNFFAHATQILDTLIPYFCVGWRATGGNSGGTWGGSATGIVDQVQIVAASGNISGNFHVYYVQ